MGGPFFDFELFRTAFDGRCSAQAQEEEDPDQTGDPGQMDAKAHERHKEITLRNKKREMMEAFTVFGSVKLQLCFNLGFVVVFVRCFCLYSVVCISRGSWPSLGRSEGRGAEIARRE